MESDRGGTYSVDLYAFGPRSTGPRPIAGRDVFPDREGKLAPERLPFPNGQSAFSDPVAAPVSGHYFRLPAGTRLPEGLRVIADGSEVQLASPWPPGHHTLYNAKEVSFEAFVHMIGDLPWQYVGKKR